MLQNILLDNWVDLLCRLASNAPLQAKKRFLILEYSVCMLSFHQQLWMMNDVNDEGEERALGTECLCPYSPPPPNSYVEVLTLSKQDLQEAIRFR